MLAKVISAALIGLDGVLITVEVDVASQGLPSFTIVGLPNKAVEESKERVRSALKNSGADFPAKRITVNLAPADLPKEGALYDLPIALGILLASGQINNQLNNSLVIGELGLDGLTRSVFGTLPFALLAKEKGLKEIFLPQVNSKEAAVGANGIQIIPVKNLLEVVKHFNGVETIFPYQDKPDILIKEEVLTESDFADIKGQEQAKRALEIAAAGGHNIILTGPPGMGKTLLAKSLPSILPSLTQEESIEVSKIYSIVGGLKNANPLVQVRPFRSPHHTSSSVGLVGGGVHPKPGEISLAHRGVLFLDEFPEFPRSVLEALRGPLEDGYVVISRANARISFPANFTLVAAANPCPCGFYGSSVKECVCTPNQIQNYQKRLSGPILDRIDLHVKVPEIKSEKLLSDQNNESSKNIKDRVQKARAIQTKRLAAVGIFTNSEMRQKEIKKFCVLPNSSLDILRQAVDSFSLSARGYFRILKVSRTIADLEGREEIGVNHIAEALQYRFSD